jgi:flagellar biosynthesis protein FlhA
MNVIDTLQKRSDITVVFGVVVIVAVMILPIPPFMLDILLSFSLSLSIVILIRSIFVKKPLDFSVFPTVLLFATLYRLALNVASTRLILLKGHEGTDAAGQVIRSFGNFVVGGNYAVGLIVFLILVVINFVVITKGAGRIAEVAARFTLDAMPGKQMAIDADLNAGLIDEAEARRRRALISQEADFYGAMDGASKFVRGDAIAGLIITGINIIGGFIIGTLQQHMPISEAAKTYTILTIGDGLVAQIPALLVSTSAGIVVSRAGSDMDLGKNIVSQLIINPKALATVSVILITLAVIPGLPRLPFLIISVTFAALAYVLSRPTEVTKEEEPEEIPQEEPPIEPFLAIEPLTLEIGYGLIPLVEPEEAPLLAKIKAMRRQLASELGFVVPSIHIKDNLQLKPHEYSFIIRGIEVGKGEVMMGYYLAVAPEGAEEIEGIPTKEPAFGLPAYWVEEKNTEVARAKGYMIVDPATVIVTHITELIKNHAWELLTRTEVQSMLDNVSRTYPKIVDELIPTHMTLGGVQRVLQNLLREKVPINDLVTILETLLDYAPITKDIELLTEYVRQALARFITKQHIAPDGSLRVLTLDTRFELAISESVEKTEEIKPDIMAKLLQAIEKAVKEMSEKYRDIQPIILCSPQSRRFVRKIVERFIPSLVILSTAEIVPSAKIYTVGVVKYED